MNNKDRYFYAIKPGFGSKNKKPAFIYPIYCTFVARNAKHII